MTESREQEIVLAIINNGHLYAAGWFDEGDCESGPSGGVNYGYRWGQLFLEQSRNGSVYLTRNKGDEFYGSPLIWRQVYNSGGFPRKGYTGWRNMVADHFRAVSRNAERNGLEFVITGVRPQYGHFSLDEILEREQAARA